MFNFNIFSEPTRPFDTMYRCYSVSMLPGTERDNVDRGGRILLPPSALDQLTRLNIVYPMLFKIINPAMWDRMTHCGVLEFVADEGKCYMPYWMMRNLLLEEGSLVKIESVSLPVANFSKFRPQSVDFLDITNPKAVLENELRSFACLTTGDIIAINYNEKIYELCVLETRPGPAVSIIECDMIVDFESPIGFIEPTERKVKTAPSILKPTGFRIDGKSTTDEPGSAPSVPRGQPDYGHKIGYMKFFRSIK